MRGHPAPRYRSSRASQAARVWSVLHRYLICLFTRLPLTSLNAVLTTLLCHTRGFFSRAFSFFFFRWFRFFSLVRSFPSCGRFGSGFWLLFLVGACLLALFLWLCGLCRVCLSFGCCCLCLGLLSFGRLCGGGSSCCLLCLWLGLGRFCACCALSRLVGGSSPFLVRVPLRLTSARGRTAFFYGDRFLD